MTKQVLLICGVLVCWTGTLPSIAEDKPATLTGCAMPLADDPDFLTLCEKDACALLRGKVDLKWAHHMVTLRGTLRLPDGVQPRTLEVTDAIKVGEACEKTCTPPVKGRGVGDRPGGKELGTAGKTGAQPKP